PRAQPGSGRGGPATHALTRSSCEWRAPRERSLKGKAEPVAARRAISDLGVSRTRGLEGATSRLVGRDRELASARELVSSVLEGSGGVLYLVGEPGIGKTRLLSEIRAGFERSKPEHGRALWIEGRCVSYGESMPYWPFQDLLRSWLGVAADDPELRVRVALRRNVDRLFGDGAMEIYPYLGALLGLTLEPDAASRLAEPSPEASQYRTLGVIRELLRRLGQDRP